MILKSIFILGAILGISGCASISVSTTSDQGALPQLKYSNNHLNATIITNLQMSDLDSLINILSLPVPGRQMLNWFNPEMDDSLKSGLIPIIDSTLNHSFNSYALDSIRISNDFTFMHFSVDTSGLKYQFHKLLLNYNPLNPIEPLFHIQNRIPDFKSLPVKHLMLPDQAVSVPRKSSRLPNAPRSYRYGIHRGIDFFSDWGSPLRAVAGGIIIRADKHFKEVSPEFREFCLEQTKIMNRTPSDIFNSILLGRTVIIDHGYNLIPGYRTITIYAHLSHIDDRLKPGYKIEAGEIFSRSGNSGTSESTLGSRGGSHLHWELILQDAGGEYFYGQGLSYEKLFPLLKNLFKDG